MLIVAFVVVSKSSGTAALERRERENEDRKAVAFLSLVSQPREINERKNNWENTKNPKILEAERIFQWNPLYRGLRAL